MGVEQAIFTTCESSIAHAGPGQQVYSYSSGMETILTTTDASILFQYEAPHDSMREGRRGRRDTPRKYAYAIVEEHRRIVGFAANHAVGGGEEESYFSHLLVTNLLNVTKYPCEYYKSPLFVEGLSGREKQKGIRPPYLYKATRMQEGQAITYESVQEFLSRDNRLAKLKRLMAALLTGRQGDGQKKIVLLGRNEGEDDELIYWIAAMTMVLPLDISRRVSFSDYEYEPLYAPYRICGSLREGCRLPLNTLTKETYLFDLDSEYLPNIPEGEELLDVFELCFRVSKDCILPFYEFMENYQYKDCDEQLYDAYELYKLITVREYISKMTRQRLHRALLFADTFAREEERKRFTASLTSLLQEGRMVEGRILKEVLWYLKQQAMKGKVVKEKLYLPLLNILYESFRHATKEKQGYESTVKEIAYFFEQTGSSVYRYYLGYLPEKEVGLLIQKTVNHWKLEEILRILKEYLLVMKPSITELAGDMRFQHFLYGLILRTDSQCKSGKGIEIQTIWQAFSVSYEYATYFYLLLWNKHQNGKEQPRYAVIVYTYYRSYFWKLEQKDQDAILEYMMMEDGNAIVSLLHYGYELEGEYQKWFLSVTKFIESHGIYGGSLLDGIMQECFENAVRVRGERYQAVLSLFLYTFRIGYRDHFINRLVPYLSASIPLVVSKEEQVALIKRLYYYQVNFNGGIIEKRVALCYRLYELREFLASNPKKREKITFVKKVAIPTMDGAETANYIKRAGTTIGEIIFKTGQVSLTRDCYQISNEKEQDFLAYILETVLRKGRKKKEYLMFLKVYVYVMEEGRDDLVARTIKSSGIEVEELSRQLTNNLNHLTAYRKLLHHEDQLEEGITSRWCKVVGRVLGAK